MNYFDRHTKAFDTIDHKVLLDKLVYMGFSDVLFHG